MKLIREFDDFDWIRSTTPSFDENNTPRVGDVLICLPGYHNSPKGPYHNEQEDPQCAGAGYADGRIIVVKEVDVWPEGHEGKKLIIWPNEDESQMYWDYDDGEVCFECGIYGFALTYYAGDELMESIDSLDWIRGIDPNQPVSFHDAKIFKTYRFEGTDFLVEAVDTCGRDSDIYNIAETVIVRNSVMTPYHDVVCDTDDDRPVFSLQLEFHSKEGEYIDTFWVMEEMLTLYQTYEDLNESVDEWDWVREIEPEIKLEPNTLYHFEPKLKVREIGAFADNIANAPQFAQWLRDLPNANGSVRSDGGIKYLITKPELPIRILGWCTETSIGYARSIYPGINVVDVRNTFSF
jgi:hypothetical protein